MSKPLPLRIGPFATCNTNRPRGNNYRFADGAFGADRLGNIGSVETVIAHHWRRRTGLRPGVSQRSFLSYLASPWNQISTVVATLAPSKAFPRRPLEFMGWVAPFRPRCRLTRATGSKGGRANGDRGFQDQFRGSQPSPVGLDRTGVVVKRRRMRPESSSEFTTTMPSCVVAMDCAPSQPFADDPGPHRAPDVAGICSVILIRTFHAANRRKTRIRENVQFGGSWYDMHIRRSYRQTVGGHC
jgi:hypothetical protein